MKFGKELDEEAVPEWRLKYLDYKQGKKKVKACGRAFKGVNRTPRTPGRPFKQLEEPERLQFTTYDFNKRWNKSTLDGAASPPSPGASIDAEHSHPPLDRHQSLTTFANSPPINIPDAQEESGEGSNESTSERDTTPLRKDISGWWRDRAISYGSIAYASPPQKSKHLPDLELPDPALTPARTRDTQSFSDPVAQPPEPRRPPTDSPDPYHVGPTKEPPDLRSRLRHRLQRNDRAMSAPGPGSRPSKPSRLRRLFTSKAALGTPDDRNVPLEAYQELDDKQADFFEFLEKELDKIEDFYKMKEEEATHRLSVLRDQLHEMRDRRLEDIQASKNNHHALNNGMLDGMAPAVSGFLKKENGQKRENGSSTGHKVSFLQPVENALKRKSAVGKTSRAMEQMSTPPGPQPRPPGHDEGNRDYVRRTHENEKVPYHFAKRRLKLALQEFYRALELLKSYTLVNRTAFRKINKKYDKAVNARPTMRFVNEKVDKAYFVSSNIIDGHLVTVEDLYARYFEKGNHKVAVNKLRSKLHSGDYTFEAFRDGVWLAAGLVFGIAGIVVSHSLSKHQDPVIAQQTSYLQQLYAGYFLAVLLFLVFVVDCGIWTRARVNYIFIFEYDTRHVLDWRQLAELPCFFFFLNGLFLWLNMQIGPRVAIWIYWPVILIGLTVLIMFLPIPWAYSEARKWWAYSNWRLLLAGLYPVEFRDFFLGDMYCSETYTMSQVELFFCLYAHDWNDPPQCNSNHSMLLGFFTTLPAIWRALQCVRRYYDSGNWFPHLANCAKYSFNILYYATLSLYRMQSTEERRVVFIVFAALNGLFCSFWDVFMDFSLGNPFASNKFLRDRLAYRRPWVYYAVVVFDVLLRNQWIFYAIFTRDLQHSSIVSFCVGLAEVIRRGVWALFRVENEHCNNVGKFRASRDIELPYSLPSSPDFLRHPDDAPHSAQSRPEDSTAVSTATDVERATPDTIPRQRRTPQTPGMRAMARVGTIIATAHNQDYTKRRRPEIEGTSPEAEALRAKDDSSDDDDHRDDEDDAIEDEEALRRLRTTDEGLTEAEDLARRGEGV